MSEPLEWMNPNIRVTRLREQVVQADTEIVKLYAEIAKLRAEVERLRAALTRLRDCDWIITPHDRMDAVRDIARQALEPKQEETK